MMKLATIGALTAAFGLAFAVAGHSGPERSGAAGEYPPGCAVSINGTIGRVPRAGLTVENRSSHLVVIFIEARGDRPRIELGTIGPGEQKRFDHTLPAGRNALLGAAAGETRPRRFREVVHVDNHGAATCRHRYVWRIE